MVQEKASLLNFVLLCKLFDFKGGFDEKWETIKTERSTTRQKGKEYLVIYSLK